MVMQGLGQVSSTAAMVHVSCHRSLLPSQPIKIEHDFYLVVFRQYKLYRHCFDRNNCPSAIQPKDISISNHAGKSFPQGYGSEYFSTQGASNG